jgi:hypothetical protein
MRRALTLQLPAAKNILYGSMTTRAKSSPVAGVCHGFFFYLDDDAEIDIEILTSYITKGLENGIPPGLEFTNHGKVSAPATTRRPSLGPWGPADVYCSSWHSPCVKNDKSTNKVWPYPFDPAEDFHDVSARGCEHVYAAMSLTWTNMTVHHQVDARTRVILGGRGRSRGD